ncbi:MAG: ammonium transporter [Microthrixaceae bacterium]
MDSGNTTWVLIGAALVLFMTPGLAFFYGGMVRARNVLNMLMMNFWCLLVVPLLWAVAGYSLAFSGEGGFIGNFDNAMLRNLDFKGGQPAVLIFLATFAAITPALISGGRRPDEVRGVGGVRPPLVVAGLRTGDVLVFAPNGWLISRGSLDFAGGTAIHVNAGIAALAMILVLGKRSGWPQKVSPPHSMPLVMLGTGILWFGWFGFNAGSALAADGRAMQAFINTMLAAAAAGLAWALVERIRDGHFTNLGVASGIVAGLVAITPACGFVTGGSAILIGAIAGVVCSYAIALKVKLGYDDALDVIGVHLVGGLVGSVLIGFFADYSAFKAINPDLAKFDSGLFFGGGAKLLGEQLLANGATIVFSFVVTFVLAKVLDATIGLRVSEETESEGLDLLEHAETAYNTAERASL